MDINGNNDSGDDNDVDNTGDCDDDESVDGKVVDDADVFEFDFEDE